MHVGVEHALGECVGKAHVGGNNMGEESVRRGPSPHYRPLDQDASYSATSYSSSSSYARVRGEVLTFLEAAQERLVNQRPS